LTGIVLVHNLDGHFDGLIQVWIAKKFVNWTYEKSAGLAAANVIPCDFVDAVVS
jgi:hypothetical protein